jgi:hypothetical protein
MVLSNILQAATQQSSLNTVDLPAPYIAATGLENMEKEGQQGRYF